MLCVYHSRLLISRYKRLALTFLRVRFRPSSAQLSNECDVQYVINGWLEIVMNSVRVFTVASESRYVVVRNVPALGVTEDLLQRLSLYGKVCEYRLLDHADDRQAALGVEGDDEDDEFADTVWVQYETVNNARHAKARGVQKLFFGSRLQISYAPQFETLEDTMDKLARRRQLLLCRSNRSANWRPTAALHDDARQPSCNPPLPPPLPPVVAQGKAEFIGPHLPSRPPLQSALDGSRPPTPQHLQSKRVAPAMTNQYRDTKRRRI